jgi:hypothetical protein
MLLPGSEGNWGFPTTHSLADGLLTTLSLAMSGLWREGITDKIRDKRQAPIRAHEMLILSDEQNWLDT